LSGVAGQGEHHAKPGGHERPVRGEHDDPA
jgi:hypothetical protein